MRALSAGAAGRRAAARRGSGERRSARTAAKQEKRQPCACARAPRRRAAPTAEAAARSRPYDASEAAPGESARRARPRGARKSGTPAAQAINIHRDVTSGDDWLSPCPHPLCGARTAPAGNIKHRWRSNIGGGTPAHVVPSASPAQPRRVALQVAQPHARKTCSVGGQRAMRAALAASSRVTRLRVTRLSAHVAPRRVATRAMSFHALSVRDPLGSGGWMERVWRSCGSS